MTGFAVPLHPPAIYNTGQDEISYSTGTTGIVEFPSVANGVRSSIIASWSSGAVSSTSPLPVA